MPKNKDEKEQKLNTTYNKCVKNIKNKIKQEIINISPELSNHKARIIMLSFLDQFKGNAEYFLNRNEEIVSKLKEFLKK